MDSPEVKRDPQVNAAYVTLRQGKQARTVEVSSSVMIDVDAQGQVLGVELLDDGSFQDVLVSLVVDGRLVLRDLAR